MFNPFAIRRRNRLVKRLRSEIAAMKAAPLKIVADRVLYSLDLRDPYPVVKRV